MPKLTKAAKLKNLKRARPDKGSVKADGAITLRVATTDIARLDGYCNRLQIGRSVLIRRLIQALPTRRKPAKSVSVAVV